MTDRGTAGLAAVIDRAAERLATNPSEAEAMIRPVLRQAPRDPRATLILASARRRQGHAREALALLEPLAKAFPRAALTQFELGVCLAAMGRTAEAVASLRQATSINPGLTEAWRHLGAALFALGDMKGADAAYDRHALSAVQDPRLRPGAEALYGGDLVRAETLLRACVTAAPNDAAGLRLLAEVFSRSGRLVEAERLLRLAHEREPDHIGGLFSYAAALFRRQNAVDALPLIERLMALSPGEPAYRNLMAGALSLVGRDAAVIDLYAGLAADLPNQPQVWLNYGHALKTVGRRDDAIAAYRRCLDLSPGMGDAYWGLANLKVERFSEADAPTMARQLERADLSPNDRLNLHFALGKAFEDQGDYAVAFANYAAGAALRRAETPYDAEETHRMAQRIMSVFTPEFLATRRSSGAAAADPIFIVGLPRSGSTLIEQILASHSAVQGTMELPTLGLIAMDLDWADRQADGPGYPECLQTLDPILLAGLGETYLAKTDIYRTEATPRFIDKMPNNFVHIGLIQLVLPNARIIDARRHPLGACFSAFKQHFAQGQGFAYDLVDLGRYYADYVALTAHFDRVLPGRVHRVIYEDLVEDTEGEVRRLLDHCGLDFESGCLRFYENQRAVRTVSSEQVRRPIFRDGLDQWRRFEPWLDPLKAALGPTLAAWRGE